jgi:hypothetical protein
MLALYCRVQEHGQIRDGTNTSQLWEIHPSNAPQLPPPEVAQPADLTPDVQVTEAAGSGNSAGGAVPRCGTCGKSFKRNQEVKRHWNQVHVPKRECPFEFCPYKWTVARPAKIKDHITKVHGSEFDPGVLQQICHWNGTWNR